MKLDRLLFLVDLEHQNGVCEQSCCVSVQLLIDGAVVSIDIYHCTGFLKPNFPTQTT